MGYYFSDNLYEIYKQDYEKTGETLPLGAFPLSPRNEGRMRCLFNGLDKLPSEITCREDFQGGVNSMRTAILVMGSVVEAMEDREKAGAA